MLFVSIAEYFNKNISATNEGTYIKFISDVVGSPDFKHACNENEAQNFSTFIDRKLTEYNLSKEDYKSAIKYFERECLLKEYEKGLSIMFPIAVGAYYIMAIFLSFKNDDFVSKFKISKDNDGKCTFWSIKCDNDIKQKLFQLHLYLNQLPVMMLTKLYSLFPKHEPTITAEELLRKGLSLILCVPEKSIEILEEETVSKESLNIIEIELPVRKIIIPYHGEDKLKTITTAQVRDIANKVYELHQNIKRLGEEKGAETIAASVAHNLRNILPGFTNTIKNIANKYPRLYIQGHAVENRINWLNILNPEVELTQILDTDLIKILINSFNSAWQLILLRGEIVKNVDLVSKFKEGNLILYPILHIITSSTSYYIVTLSFVTETRGVLFLDEQKWGGNCLVPSFNESYYTQYKKILRVEGSTFKVTNKNNNEVTLVQQNIKIPKDAIAGIEGSIEEIFYNALKYCKRELPILIKCTLTNEGIEIVNNLPDKYTQNSGGGLIGNKTFYKRIGWHYSAKPERDTFINTIIYKRGLHE